MLKGHKLPVPPGLPCITPLPCLTPSATEHPVIRTPSLSRTSQHSVNLGVPKFPGCGAEPSATDSHAAAHCIPAAPSHPPLCTLPWDALFQPEEQMSLILPLGDAGLSRVLRSPGAARDPLVPPPAWPPLKMYRRHCAANQSLFQLHLWIPHIFGIIPATPLVCDPVCLRTPPRSRGCSCHRATHQQHRGFHSPMEGWGPHLCNWPP